MDQQHASGVECDQAQTDRASLEAIGLAIYRIDDDGCCTYINRAALELLGYAAEEVLGRNMHDLIHHSYPDGARFPQAACPLLATRSTGRPVRLSNETLWRKDGSFFTAEYSAWPMLVDGRVAGVVVTFIDSAEHGAARRRLALQVTVSRILAGTGDLDTVLPQLLAAIGGGIGCQAGFFWDLDRREKLLRVKASWVAPGVAADALIAESEAQAFEQGVGLAGLAWAQDDLVHIPDLRGDHRFLRKVSAEAAGLRFGIAFPVKVGRRAYGVVELFGRGRLRVDDDFLDSVAALGQQIGQYLRRKRAEEALEHREQEFRALADNIPQLAWMADASGAVYWYNKRWLEFTGAAPEEALGWNWQAVIHPEHDERVVAGYRRAIASGEPWEDIFRLRGADGGYRWFLTRALPIRDADGCIVRWFGTNTDVTEQRRIEEELAAAKEAAEEANRAKSQFIANMSHELRTPLSAVIGYAEMLEEEVEDFGPAAAVIREDLGKIETSARHLLSLINGVLDLSKIEAGKMDVDIERVEIAPLVQEVSDTVRMLMRKKGNAFDVAVAPGIGAMLTDPVKLRQCLFNLLSNAAKFTEQGQVTLAARREGNELTFEVADTGIGMSPDQLSRLFERFAQADASTTRRFGGTGLGLAITKAFAEMLGGNIAVASQEGKGSTFTLTLPADHRARGDAEGTTVLPDDQGGAQLLVIDDDPHMRDLLTRFLRREGFGVAVAPDGESGLRLARERRPCAILLDVMMPRMDGWAVLSALKADPALAAIPVIMVSMVHEKGLAYSLGAADYLTKPIQWGRLKSAVDRYRCHAACGWALVVDTDAATSEELREILASEGWTVADATSAEAAIARITERRPDLILVNLELPTGDGFTLLRRLQRAPQWRTIPVIALAEGGLPPEERSRLRDQVRQVIDPEGDDSSDELVAELRRLAAGQPSCTLQTKGNTTHG